MTSEVKGQSLLCLRVIECFERFRKIKEVREKSLIILLTYIFTSNDLQGTKNKMKRLRSNDMSHFPNYKKES